MENDCATSVRCHASGNDAMSCFDGSAIEYYEFSGMDLLRDGTDDDASDSSYSSYCNDSLQLSGVPKKAMAQQQLQQQRRSSIDGAIHKESVLTLNELQRSASVAEMISWLSTGDEDCEDDLDVESSYCLTRTKLAPVKNVDGKGPCTGSFSSDILASQAVAGGAGRAA